MEIIFDKKILVKVAKNREIDTGKIDPENTAEKLIERREEQLKKLGEFIGADEIKFIDYHTAEEYVIIKGNKKLFLKISGSNCDGGWMTVTIIEE